MARTDAIVLGAGIVGTSIALHLAKRGLAVALVDRRRAGRGDLLRQCRRDRGQYALPASVSRRASVRCCGSRSSAPPRRTTISSFLPQIAPWLLAYRANSTIERRIQLRQPDAAAVRRARCAEHEALMAESGATRYLRKDGWLKVYRSEAAFAATARERALAAEFGLPLRRARPRRRAGARAGAGAAIPATAIYWPSAASVTNPLAVTRAYVARFTALGGVVLTGDARTLHRANGRWRVETDEGPVDSREAVVALGPWAPDVLEPLGIKLPLGGQARLSPAFPPARQRRADAAGGRCRDRLLRRADGAGDPAHHRRRIRRPRRAADAGAVRPAAAGGARAVSARRAGRGAAWMGSRPCFADSRPVIGRAPGQTGPVARLRPCPLGPDARPRDRAAGRRDDDRRDAVLRSGALCGGAVHAELTGDVTRSIGAHHARGRAAARRSAASASLRTSSS